jgi:hypothetical protein
MKRFLSLVLFIAGPLFAIAGQSSNLSPAPGAPPPSPLTQVSLTPNDMQELRAARSAALQKDPNLQTDGLKIMERMRAFEDKLDAAMVKSDPTLAPLVAKFEAGRPRTTTPPATQPHPEQTK